MTKDTKTIIKEKVAAAQGIKTAVIQYNFELPESKYITKDNFYGVEAKFNQNVKPGQAQLTYTM